MESLTPMNQTRLFTNEFASKLIRRIQNRNSSQKVRKQKNTKLNTFEEQINKLEKENSVLKIENKSLKEKLGEITKQMGFYKNTIERSLTAHKEENADIDIVTEHTEDGYYRRVDDGVKNRKAKKMFMVLTIFTIMVQTLNCNTGMSGIVSSEETTSKLNFFNIGGDSISGKKGW